jgi:hypothetical protein
VRRGIDFEAGAKPGGLAGRALGWFSSVFSVAAAEHFQSALSSSSVSFVDGNAGVAIYRVFDPGEACRVNVF